MRLFNKDLTWDIGKLQECPQANISINTDDNGNPVYNRQMVYQCRVE